jgi:hypothetical protein
MEEVPDPQKVGLLMKPQGNWDWSATYEYVCQYANWHNLRIVNNNPMFWLVNEANQPVATWHAYP